MKRTLLTLTIVALLTAAPASAQLDTTMYVALGDNITAGFVSGGLVDCYQMYSYSSLLADQANAPIYEMPLISAPGVPSVLQLTSLINGAVIEPVGDFMDAFPYNVTYPNPYNNLAVPTATLYDTLFQIGDLNNLATGNLENILFDLILRIPQVQDPSTGELLDFTMVTQAVALQPTFATVWIGMSDVMDAIYTATPIEGVTMTPVQTFGFLFPQAVGGLVTQTEADVVLFTIPDFTEIAFATTLPPTITIPDVGTVPIMGTNGPLSPGSRVTLFAQDLLEQGYGVPLPGFPPLPEDFNLVTGEPGYVLRPEEIATIKGQIAAFNGIIQATADQFGLPVFDAGGVIDDMNFGEGFVYGGVRLNGDFLTGGLVGYDAIHPNQFAHTILAAELVEFLNDTYGADIPSLDVSDIMFDNPCIPLPSPMGVAPEEVVFSPEARETLDAMFIPELPSSDPL
jgi:hypothetical protein